MTKIDQIEALLSAAIAGGEALSEARPRVPRFTDGQEEQIGRGLQAALVLLVILLTGEQSDADKDYDDRALRR